MPISKHYNGHGTEVMDNMKKEYGKDAKKIFYSTENKRKNVKKAARKRV